MRFLITGGHLSPALAIVDEILSSSLNRKVEIIFVGRKYNLDMEKTYSLEYQEIKKRKIKFYNLPAGRLTRTLTKKTLVQLIKVPLGFIEAGRILSQTKPEAILSFGGYIGLPIVICGYLKKIPIYLHEQTIRPGLANRLSSFFAKKVFISFSEAKRYFNQKKAVVTGNPLRHEIFKVIKIPFKIEKRLPVIYISGGSLGSHSINLHIENIITDLLEEFVVIHQTGGVKEYSDFKRLSSFKKRLPKRYQSRYFLKEYFFGEEIGYIYRMSDFFVGRAGANTFFELITLGKPAIFIPLPWSANHEQQEQAEIFNSYKAGEIFYQHQSSQKLLMLIKKVYRNLEFYKKNLVRLKSLYGVINASKTIVKEIFY